MSTGGYEMENSLKSSSLETQDLLDPRVALLMREDEITPRLIQVLIYHSIPFPIWEY